MFARDAAAAAEVIASVRGHRAVRRPGVRQALARTSPTSSRVALACVDAGADGLR